MPRWDLTAGGIAPNLSPSRAHLRFDDLPDDWVPIAKTLAMAMLQPTHTVVREAHVYRSNRPYKTKSIQHALAETRYLAKWAETHDYTADLSQWTDDDSAAYLASVRATRAVTAEHSANDLLRHLVAFGPLMQNGGLRVRVGRSKTGSSGEIRTPVIPPDAFWPLIRACWTYIDVFGPDVLAARDDIDALDANPHPDKWPAAQTIDRAIDSWLASPDAFIPLHIYTLGRGKAGEINWDGLALCTTPRIRAVNFYNGSGPARRQRVRDAIAAGVPTKLGYSSIQPANVDRPGGTRGPWIKGFDRVIVSKELTQIRNAAYIFVAIMTMMRDSEVQGIAAGAVGTHYGAPAVTSILHKGQTGAGTPQRWWVSPPVVRALEVAERITRDPDRLFGSVRTGTNRELAGFDQHEQIRSFIDWVNDHSPHNGLLPIPVKALAPHMFRRTMAVITANEPDGEIALGITLKHNATRALANATTSGYAAPTPEWAKEFDHHAKEAAAGELVADWARHTNGEQAARGPGATAFVNSLSNVTDRAETKVAVGNERMLRNLLRDEFATIRLGTLNHCLGDPSKALCLEGASAAVKAGGPIPSMCQPSTCRNSVITDKHLPIWQHEETDLVEKLKDKKMADAHSQRLETQLADVRRITQQEPK
jgi:integrase